MINKAFATDFESVVSTISPLRRDWISPYLQGFLQNRSGSFVPIWTASGHKSGHTANRPISNAAHATTTMRYYKTTLLLIALLSLAGIADLYAGH